jgi:large subunit ribosomal protein L13
MGNHKHHKIEIDAAGIAPGRLASKVATLLMGKHKPSFESHQDHGDSVLILNAEQAVFTGKKLVQKIYRHHSMHPGGLKEEPINRVIKKDPREVIRLAISKMLPKNKMRVDRMKRVYFK